MAFITKIILISSLLSISTAFTASLKISEGRFNTEVITRFYADNENSYDMGIGKNQPLHTKYGILTDNASYNDEENVISEENDVYEAVQFMAQYESTNKFPSPLDAQQQHHHQATDQTNTDNTEKDTIKSSKQKSLPKVQPKRQLEDVLFILSEDRSASSKSSIITSSNSHPVMIQSSRNRQIDINSVWVEMLIHNQQTLGTLGLQAA